MKTAIALGTFDGLHIGHREVLDLPSDYKRVAITFKEPFKSFLSGKSELIMTFKDKENVLKELGFVEIVTLDFETVRNLSPTNFLYFLKEKFNPKFISCGFNYRFGKNGEGNTELLESFCKENDIKFNCVSPVKYDDLLISSTLIRQVLAEGKVSFANKLLTKPFSFEGEVIKGDKRGRTISFPTINIKYPKDLVTVRFGVYKTKITFDSKEYQGITNIGLRPTFKSDYIISETYIKNFSGDLYGKNIRITLLEFLRDEIKFDSLSDLKTQISKDLKKID